MSPTVNSLTIPLTRRRKKELAFWSAKNFTQQHTRNLTVISPAITHSRLHADIFKFQSEPPRKESGATDDSHYLAHYQYSKRAQSKTTHVLYGAVFGEPLRICCLSPVENVHIWLNSRNGWTWLEKADFRTRVWPDFFGWLMFDRQHVYVWSCQICMCHVPVAGMERQLTLNLWRGMRKRVKLWYMLM